MWQAGARFGLALAPQKWSKRPLRCRHARDVVVHVSHDAWVEEEKEDVPMRPLSQKEVRSNTPLQGGAFRVDVVRGIAISGNSIQR